MEKKAYVSPRTFPTAKHIPLPSVHWLMSLQRKKILDLLDRMVASEINNESENISDSTVDAHADKFSPESILTDQHKLSRTIRRISPKIDTKNQRKETRSKDSKNIYKESGCPGIYSPSLAKSVSKPTSVKSINNTLVGEIPFCRVKDKIDTRESEDDDVLTRIESIRDTEEHNGD